MKLEVPLVRQGKSSLDCGIACLSMVLKYYGIEKSISDLKKDIKVYEGIGTYAPQIGKYLIDNGFEIEIITMNPFLFTRKFKEKSRDELISYLKERQKIEKEKRFKEPLNFFIEFMDSGGKITLKVPDVLDIKEEILEGRPLGALITSNFLLGDKPMFNFHFNLITGIDENYIYVNDPLNDYRGGHHKYPINDFMYAIYASAHGDLDNASIIKIKKK